MSIRGFHALIIGAPASGKGTISSRIVKNFNLKHISSGDLLRKNIDEKTPLGVEAKKYADKGQLVPDKHMIDCILNELKQSGDNWLLDGFPRTVEQANKLWEVKKLNVVMNLIVPFDVIIERVQGRWIHLPSGRVYNIGFNEPKVPFTDDVTGEPLQQRPDDRPEAVRERLKIYDTITKPVIQYYRDRDIITDFTGSTSDEIWPQVQQFLDENFKRNMESVN